MRVLVCGSRTWGENSGEKRTLELVLKGFRMSIETLIHGAARGADTLAAEWAESENRLYGGTIDVESFPADWETHKKAAGPIRNRKMLQEGKPDLVVAFCNDLNNSSGTADMVKISRKAGLYVINVSLLQPIVDNEQPLEGI